MHFLFKKNTIQKLTEQEIFIALNPTTVSSWSNQIQKMSIDGKNLKVDSDAINQIGTFVNKLANAVQKLAYPEKNPGTPLVNITEVQEESFMAMVKLHQATIAELTELHDKTLHVLQKMDRVAHSPGAYISQPPSKVAPDPKTGSGAANIVNTPYAIAITRLTEILESNFIKLDLLKTSIQVKEREIDKQAVRNPTDSRISVSSVLTAQTQSIDESAQAAAETHLHHRRQ